MKSVLASSDIFEASTKLQAAATALEKVLRGEQLRSEERENLKWCGVFLEEIDWRAPADAATEAASHLSVRATEVRPFFFATLRNTQQLFHDAGIEDPEQIREFLSSTYHFLRSTEATHDSARVEHLDLAVAFLQRLSTELLSRLSGNGVPTERDRSASLLA
jgi:hypothetical protein